MQPLAASASIAAASARSRPGDARPPPRTSRAIASAGCPLQTMIRPRACCARARSAGSRATSDRLAQQRQRPVRRARRARRLAGRQQPARRVARAPRGARPARAPTTPPRSRAAPRRRPPPPRAPRRRPRRSRPWPRPDATSRLSPDSTPASARWASRRSAGLRPVVRGAADDRVRERHRAAGDPHQPALLRVREPLDVGRARAHAAEIVPRSAPAYAAATSSARPAGGSSSSIRPANAARSRPPGAIGSSRPTVPARWSGVSVPGSSTSASGLPAATSATAQCDRRRQIRRGPREQRERRGAIERVEPQLRQPQPLERGVLRLAHRQRHRDPAARPARGVEHALARRRVEPLQVVDDREHRALGGRRVQQPERRDADREPVAGRRRPERERGGQRVRLLTWERRETVQNAGPGGPSAPRTRARPPSRRRASASTVISSPQRSTSASSSVVLPIPASPRTRSAPSAAGADPAEQLVERAQLGGAAHVHLRPNLSARRGVRNA